MFQVLLNSALVLLAFIVVGLLTWSRVHDEVLEGRAKRDFKAQRPLTEQLLTEIRALMAQSTIPDYLEHLYEEVSDVMEKDLEDGSWQRRYALLDFSHRALTFLKDALLLHASLSKTETFQTEQGDSTWTA